MEQSSPIDFIHSSWDEVQFSCPSDIPTMISQQEQRFLYFIANKFYQEYGDIVEVGTWLGGSSACLAQGLKDRGSARKLTCYDNYVWTKSYEQKSKGIRLQEGEDFHPIFKKLINDKYDNVNSIKTQIKDLRWSGGPIEILFIDAPKNKYDMQLVIECFFSYLVPGFSTVIFQDFFYSPAYEVPATILNYGESLQLSHIVENSSSAAFKFLSFNYDNKNLDYSDNISNTIDQFHKLIEKLPPTEGDFLSISLAMLLYDNFKIEESKNVLVSRKMSEVGIKRLNYLRSLNFIKSRYVSLL